MPKLVLLMSPPTCMNYYSSTTGRKIMIKISKLTNTLVLSVCKVSRNFIESLLCNNSFTSDHSFLSFSFLLSSFFALLAFFSSVLSSTASYRWTPFKRLVRTSLGGGTSKSPAITAVAVLRKRFRGGIVCRGLGQMMTMAGKEGRVVVGEWPQWSEVVVLGQTRLPVTELDQRCNKHTTRAYIRNSP